MSEEGVRVSGTRSLEMGICQGKTKVIPAGQSLTETIDGSKYFYVIDANLDIAEICEFSCKDMNGESRTFKCGIDGKAVLLTEINSCSHDITIGY